MSDKPEPTSSLLSAPHWCVRVAVDRPELTAPSTPVGFVQSVLKRLNRSMR